MTWSPNRRDLFRYGGLALGAGVLLSACGGGGGGGQGAAGGGGGTLRAGFTGGGTSESLDPFAQASAVDFVRVRAVHGTFGHVDPDSGDVVLDVLSAIEPSPDLSRYTLTIRPDARFSDASPVTARDVAFSLTRIGADPGFGGFLSDFDLPATRVVDDRTVELVTLSPIADAALSLAAPGVVLFKEGTQEFGLDTPSCGPYRLVEFQPGVGTVLEANPEWIGSDGRRPATARLELRSIADDQARANAVRAGQLDYAHDLPALAVRDFEGDPGFVVDASTSPAVTGVGAIMNMTVAPFDDLDVRRAVKLAIDRQAILDQALLGRGEIGNDLFSPGFPDYPQDLPSPVFDPDQARALLAGAGVGPASTPIPLTTTSESPGLLETCTLIAQQLSAVGLPVTIDERPPGALYADPDAYQAFPFAATYSTALPPLQYYQSVRAPESPYNGGWDRPDVAAAVLAARGLSGPARTEASAAVHRTLLAEDNVLLPVFRPVLSVRVPALTGIALEQYPAFDRARLE